MEDSVLTSDALKTVIPLLQRGETILDALARIGKGASKKPKWQNKRNKNRSKQNGAEDTEMTEEDPAEAARKQTIDALTGAADILMNRGNNDVYDTERELLTRQYRRETGEEWVDPPKEDTEPSTADGQAATLWQFRWSDARDGGVIHGPYDGPTMESWKGAGYFGEGVEFRKADAGEWSSTVTFV